MTTMMVMIKFAVVVVVFVVVRRQNVFPPRVFRHRTGTAATAAVPCCYVIVQDIFRSAVSLSLSSEDSR
jgi:hypothetical protein